MFLIYGIALFLSLFVINNLYERVLELEDNQKQMVSVIKDMNRLEDKHFEITKNVVELCDLNREDIEFLLQSVESH